MTQKKPEMEGKNNPSETKEAIESLSNLELAYKLALYLEKGYDVSGHSGDKSIRSYMLRLFFSLNKEYDIPDIDIDENIDLITETALQRNKGTEATEKFLIVDSIDVKNKKVLSVLLLKKILKHYAKMVEANIALSQNKPAWSDKVDYSFSKELPLVKTIYDLALADINLNDADMATLSSRYRVEELVPMIEAATGAMAKTA